jgi:hypothetical protein
MTDAQLEVARQHSSAWQQHLGYGKPNMTCVCCCSLWGGVRVLRRALSCRRGCWRVVLPWAAVHCGV